MGIFKRMIREGNTVRSEGRNPAKGIKKRDGVIA